MTYTQQTSMIPSVFVLDVLCDKIPELKKCQNKDGRPNFSYIFNESYIQDCEHIKLCNAIMQNLDNTYSIIIMKQFTKTGKISERSYTVPYEELDLAVLEFLQYMDVFYSLSSFTVPTIYEQHMENKHMELVNFIRMK